MQRPDSPPCVIVSPPNATSGQALSAALEADGWSAAMVAADSGYSASIMDAAALVVLAVDDPAPIAALLRARGGVAETVPMIALADGVEAAGPIDAVVPVSGGIAALVAEADRWRPEAGLATLDRLAAVFGAEQLDGLAAGLRSMLIKGLAQPAAGKNVDPALADLAHRIAGLAGSLGFARVSQSWLAVAGGDSGALVQARRDARCAVAAIDRRQSSAKR